MKDKVLICSAVLLCYIIFIFSVKPAVQFASDKFWGFVSQQLNKEEEEQNQKIANGEIVRGKDTVLIWNNKYEIGHYFDGDHLSIKNEDYTFSNVLKNVKRHKVENEKLYIIFDEGLAVIDKNNICRIYILPPGGEENELPEEQYIISEYVQYLSDFAEFTEEEQDILIKYKGM